MPIGKRPAAALLTFFLATGCATSVSRDAGQWTIATWLHESSPEGIAEFGITQLRMGCDLTPEECTQRAAAIRQSTGVAQVAVAINRKLNDLALLKDYAARYAALGNGTTGVAEIGFDDFYKFMRKNKFSGFESVITAAKTTNPDLRFSVTLYEDQLASIDADEALFPTALRERIDRIYLYIHFRENGINYAQYVSQARALFPKAEVFGGSYAYDRIDYIRCGEGLLAAPCSRDREIDLYRRSLVEQISLLRSGVLTGLEFYPGHFGREEQWSAWNTLRICRPERKAQCIENTKEMRRVAAELLNAR